MNYYYDLPIEIIDHIESYLIIKPNEIDNFINNPPKNIQEILFQKIKNTNFERNYWRKTEQQIVDYNNEKDVVNKNLLKFCLEFGIKSTTYLGSRKAFKYGLIPSMKHCVNFRTIIPSCDHVREFITKDKKHIIISCPYRHDNLTDEEHFKYKFIKYPNYLYKKDCSTYILVLE